MTLSRRAVALGMAGLPVFWSLPALAALDTSFDIRRGSGSIGSHRVTATPVPGGIDARIDIDITVRLLGIPVYSYRLEAQERWRDGVLDALEAQGNDNGTAFRTTVRREGSVLRVAGREGGTAPLDAVPTTYWTSQFLDRTRWIDIQAGRVMTVRAARIADPVPGGGAGQGWAVSDGDTFALDLWYGPSGVWNGCRFEARGAQVTYRPTAHSGAAPRITAS